MILLRYFLPLFALFSLFNQARGFLTVTNATSDLGTTVFFNHDIPTPSWYAYEVTGNVVLVNFTDAVHCELSSSVIVGKSDIVVIDYDWALTVGNCDSIAQIAKQIKPKLGADFALFLSSYDLYWFGYPHMEHYGDIENVVDVVVTLVENKFGQVFSEVVSVSVEADTNPFVDITYPNTFIAYKVIFTVPYCIAWICVTIELLYVFWHREFQPLRIGSFACVWYFCIARIIETSVDPFRSTGLLGHVGHDAVWWSGFYVGSTAFVFLTSAWLRVAAPAISKSGTQNLAKAAKYLLIGANILVLIVAILQVLSSAFPDAGEFYYISMIIYSSLLICIIAEFTVLFVSGSRIISVLKVFQTQGSSERAEVIRRFSFIMWLAFFGLLLILVGILVVLGTYLNSNASNTRVYASIANHVLVDIGSYLMIAGVIYGLNPFRKMMRDTTASESHSGKSKSTGTQLSLTGAPEPTSPTTPRSREELDF